MDRQDRQTGALSRDTEPVKLAGRYRLTEVISRGGFADMWQAEDEVLGRTVAVKMLRPEAASEGATKRLFRVEALAAARLTHANITSVFDTGEHGGAPFLVMEYLGGGSLRDILTNGAIHPLRAAEWAAEICSALAQAHQSGIVHGDLRPENVLFTEGGHLKVSDFAIARAAVNTRSAGSNTGSTSAYACPEPNPDFRGDLYSLGVVLFESLVGVTPDKAATPGAGKSAPAIPRPGQIRPGIPMELDAAVLKLLSADPARRFPSALSVRSTLESLVDEAQPPARHAAPQGSARTSVSAPAPQISTHESRPAHTQSVPRTAPVRTAPRQSFLRTEGKWLLLIVFLAAAVGAVLAFPGLRPELPGSEVPPERPEASTPLQVVRSFDFDPPPGDNRENTARIPAAFDKDPATSWATSSYKTADFGRLKDGVGIAFDLGTVRKLSGIKVSSVAGGWQASLRSSDDGTTWSAPGAGMTAGADQVFAAEGEHRYWMVWITSLVKTPGEGTTDNVFAVAIKEIEALGN